MAYLVIGLIAAWTMGVLFFVGRALNFSRLVFNNVEPGKSYYANFFRLSMRSLRFIDGSVIDPESLNEVGKKYRKEAIRNERIAVAWVVLGFIILISGASYFKSS